MFSDMVSLTSNNHRATSVSYMRKRFVCKIFIVFFFSVEYYLCLGCVFPSLPVIRSPTFFVSLVCRVCAVVSQCLSFLFYFDSLSPRLFCFPSYSLITQLPSCSVFLSYLLCHPVCLPECFRCVLHALNFFSHLDLQKPSWKHP